MTNLYNIDSKLVEVQVPVEMHQNYDAERGLFLLEADSLDGYNNQRNWAMMSLQFPTIDEDGEILVRVCLTVIPGNTVKVNVGDNKLSSFRAQVPDPSKRGTANNLVRLRTNSTRLSDLFEAGVFSDEKTMKRVAAWCVKKVEEDHELMEAGEEAATKGKSLTIVPANEEAAIIFSLKENYNPTTGELAEKTPVGISQFCMRGFTLNTTSGLTSFEGFATKKVATNVTTKVTFGKANVAEEEEVTV